MVFLTLRLWLRKEIFKADIDSLYLRVDAFYESVSISKSDGTIRYIPLSLNGYNRVDTPVWSPDGKRLIFVATRASDGKKDVFSIALNKTDRPYKVALDVTGVVAWQSLGR